MKRLILILMASIPIASGVLVADNVFITNDKNHPVPVVIQTPTPTATATATATATPTFTPPTPTPMP